MSLVNAEIFRNEAAREAGRIYSLSRAATLILSGSGVTSNEEARDIVYDLVGVIKDLSIKAEIATDRIEMELMRLKST